MSRAGRPIDRPFRRCRWCNRVLSGMAIQGEERYEKPHCDTSPTCNWGVSCWEQRLKETA